MGRYDNSLLVLYSVSARETKDEGLKNFFTRIADLQI